MDVGGRADRRVGRRRGPGPTGSQRQAGPLSTDDRLQDDEMLDPLRSFRLDGKVAVVTGASSGLGARGTSRPWPVGPDQAAYLELFNDELRPRLSP
jgi:hypothetical protein